MGDLLSVLTAIESRLARIEAELAGRGPKKLTPEQTAERLGVAVRTLADWRQTGAHPELPYYRAGKGPRSPIRYLAEDVERMRLARTWRHTSEETVQSPPAASSLPPGGAASF